MKTSTGDALRLILATVLLWLAEVVWDLSDWLQGVSRRVERPLRRSSRGMVRVGLLATLAGVGLVAGAAPALRGTAERPGIEAGRAEQLRERSADVAEGIARGCASARLDVVAGIQDGVWVMRCRQPVENLGVMPPPPAARFPAKVRARAPEERGSAGSIRVMAEQGQAGASAGRAGAGIDSTGGIE